jgi:ADP-ribose pyrophosphatase YjhB (NUDIX family)
MNELIEDCFHLGVKVLLSTNEHKILLLEKQHCIKGIYWDLPGGRLQKGRRKTGSQRRAVCVKTTKEKRKATRPLIFRMRNILR